MCSQLQQVIKLFVSAPNLYFLLFELLILLMKNLKMSDSEPITRSGKDKILSSTFELSENTYFGMHCPIIGKFL